MSGKGRGFGPDLSLFLMNNMTDNKKIDEQIDEFLNTVDNFPFSITIQIDKSTNKPIAHFFIDHETSTEEAATLLYYLSNNPGNILQDIVTALASQKDHTEIAIDIVKKWKQMTDLEKAQRPIMSPTEFFGTPYLGKNYSPPLTDSNWEIQFSPISQENFQVDPNILMESMDHSVEAATDPIQNIFRHNLNAGLQFSKMYIAQMNVRITPLMFETIMNVNGVEGIAMHGPYSVIISIPFFKNQEGHTLFDENQVLDQIRNNLSELKTALKPKSLPSPNL